MLRVSAWVLVFGGWYRDKCNEMFLCSCVTAWRVWSDWCIWIHRQCLFLDDVCMRFLLLLLLLLFFFFFGGGKGGGVYLILKWGWFSRYSEDITAHTHTQWHKVRQERGGAHVIGTFSLSLLYDQPGPFGQRDFTEKKYFWTFGWKWQSKDTVVCPVCCACWLASHSPSLKYRRQVN